jgi:hypothetical protein
MNRRRNTPSSRDRSTRHDQIPTLTFPLMARFILAHEKLLRSLEPARDGDATSVGVKKKGRFEGRAAI